jgi:protein-tyrosine phosphatase
MKYAVFFTLLGLLVMAIAMLSGGWTLVLLWPAVTLLTLGGAYGGVGPGLLGKRPDGQLAPWAVLLLMPYLVVNWVVWHLYRLLAREPCSHEIVPGLWLGRRAFAHELPAGVELVVDMTAEFAAPRDLGVGRVYHCLPTLDGTAPDEAHFRAAVEKVTARSSPVYIFCAQGHGRSATVAAAVLVRRGLAADAVEAEEMLRQLRPGVRLTRTQRRLLARFASLPSK